MKFKKNLFGKKIDSNKPLFGGVDEKFINESFENQKENEEKVKEGFWEKTKKVAAKIPFTKDAIAMYYCAIDSKTPTAAKVIAFGALAYFIGPIDAIPDVIVGLGYTDDAAIILAAAKAINDNVTSEHQENAMKFLKSDQ
jgi:uncharacterized membrane protein YkvA (DUF1232 family)